MKTNTNILKAPFNFVPLNEKVYFPAWSDRISQDIPFSDGLDGVIDVSIETLTPLFIRNGHSQEDAKDSANSSISAHPKRYDSFSNVNVKYMIPGTSFKGCIRKNLEIMSFGKMRLQKSMKFAEAVNLDSKKYRKDMSNVCGGWLYRRGNSWFIDNVGEPLRISHQDLDLYFNQYIQNEKDYDVLKNYFSKDSYKYKNIDEYLNNEEEIDKNKTIDRKSSDFKYYLLSKLSIDSSLLTRLKFSEKSKYLINIDHTGSINGTIVFTGQSSARNNNTKSGKNVEFVFCDEIIDDCIPVSEDLINRISIVYSVTEIWEEWKRKVEEKIIKKIPVFFRKDKNGGILDFGFSRMYKIPFNKGPFDILPLQHKLKESMDLSDCIFGRVLEDKDRNDNTSDSKNLRGRVQFSSLFSENVIKQKSVRLILNSPKASYYPLYVKQDSNISLNTYDSEGSTIAGWKRYYMRKETWEKNEGNDNLDTEIFPVLTGENAPFKGKIRFHNLRPVELGALLSSLSNHGLTNTYHQLGQGKPYGFGKVQLDIDSLSINNSEENIEYYEYLFEKHMKDNKFDMITNNSINENITLSSVDVEKSVQSEYMSLKNNEFEDGKKKMKRLPLLSENNLLKDDKNISHLKSLLSEEISNIVNHKEKSRVVDQYICSINTLFDSAKYDEVRHNILELLKIDNSLSEKYMDMYSHSYYKEFEKEFILICDAINNEDKIKLNTASSLLLSLKKMISPEQYNNKYFSLDKLDDQCSSLCEKLKNYLSFEVVIEQKTLNQILSKAVKYKVKNDNIITELECQKLILLLPNLYKKMSSSEKKKWRGYNSNKWNNLKELFPDKAQEIFNQITQK